MDIWYATVICLNLMRWMILVQVRHSWTKEIFFIVLMPFHCLNKQSLKLFIGLSHTKSQLIQQISSVSKYSSSLCWTLSTLSIKYQRFQHSFLDFNYWSTNRQVIMPSPTYSNTREPHNFSVNFTCFINFSTVWY